MRPALPEVFEGRNFLPDGKIMLCELCKKNEASIHIQEIVGGEKKTLHICEYCAAHKQNTLGLEFGMFNLAEMLYNLSAKIPVSDGAKKSSSKTDTDEEALSKQPPEGGDPEEEKKEVNLVCPVCHWDLAGLRKTGRLGCPNCYEVFKEILDEALPTMHRGTVHAGKIPGDDRSVDGSCWLRELSLAQQELNELIRKEEYEKAAVVRDRIIDLKRKLSGQERMR